MCCWRLGSIKGWTAGDVSGEGRWGFGVDSVGGLGLKFEICEIVGQNLG